MRLTASHKILLTAGFIGAVSLILALWPQSKPSATQRQPAVRLDIADTASRGLESRFYGNGRENLQLRLRNPNSQEWLVRIRRGAVVENATATVVILADAEISVGPGEEKLSYLKSAAVFSTNPVGELDFGLAARRFPKLDPLLEYFATHKELSQQSIQTAVLVLMENLPLGAFAKFSQKGGVISEALGTTAYTAELENILRALIMLRAVGCRTEELAISIDPQLKIEAMIDPRTKELAMSYYQIDPKNEWAYWKNELLNGDPATRHYAFYGIARFYPETALKMLPQWAKEPKVDNTCRLSAIQALGEIAMPQAVILLDKLSSECGSQTELGKAASQASESSKKRLAESAGR